LLTANLSRVCRPFRLMELSFKKGSLAKTFFKQLDEDTERVSVKKLPL